MSGDEERKKERCRELLEDITTEFEAWAMSDMI